MRRAIQQASCPCYQQGVPPDDARERALAEIVRGARANRAKPSRAMWIAASIVLVVSAVVFVIVMFGDGDASRELPRPQEPALGFSSGLVIGLAAGIPLGLAIARQRKSR